MGYAAADGWGGCDAALRRYDLYMTIMPGCELIGERPTTLETLTTTGRSPRVKSG